MWDIGEEFQVHKTRNKFIEVTFHFDGNDSWVACVPLYYEQALVDFHHEEVEGKLEEFHRQMNFENRSSTINRCDERYTGKRNTETYKVFKHLLECEWQCRTCGVGKINDQPAARIRDIKKKGFIVATQNRECEECGASQFHDILLPYEMPGKVRDEFRKPINARMRNKIYEVLGPRDAFWGRRISQNDFVIDHKFPSQRWTEAESDNDQLTDEQIRSKFQILDNQLNMLKSRKCDECCDTGVRPSFLDIAWFYAGDSAWSDNSSHFGSGCYGCPWFDLIRWKRELFKFLKRD